MTPEKRYRLLYIGSRQNSASRIHHILKNSGYQMDILTDPPEKITEEKILSYHAIILEQTGSNDDPGCMMSRMLEGKSVPPVLVIGRGSRKSVTKINVLGCYEPGMQFPDDVLEKKLRPFMKRILDQCAALHNGGKAFHKTEDTPGKSGGGNIPEDELRQYARNLAESNRELQEFAYIVSHDLQEPLRMITSYLQLLAMRYQGQLDKNADEYIHYAVDGAERMSRMIRDLLLYSRVETRGNPFTMTDCGQVLHDVLMNLTLLIEENNAAVESDKLPRIKADQSQMEQIFQNLIHNAIKFHRGQPPHIRIRCKEHAKYWEFSVQDNGIGIPADQKNRAFLIFQRLHDNLEYSGTGIGLAVCKRIVNRHGGNIWIESEEGEGSTVLFTIPKTPGQKIPDFNADPE